MNSTIKNAVDVALRAQRNYDLSKSIPDKDLESLIYSACNSPSKQNEAHYELMIFTDLELIEKIYEKTKYFSLIQDEEDVDNLFEENNGQFWQNKNLSVHNSQVLANVLFVYIENKPEPRGGNTLIAQTTDDENTESYRLYQEQINYSIGISTGELILTASLLGYKTGICSAFCKPELKTLLGSNGLPKLLVGVGHGNDNLDRKQHAHAYNKDIPEKFRTGKPDEKWKFPSFDKTIKVSINGI